MKVAPSFPASCPRAFARLAFLVLRPRPMAVVGSMFWVRTYDLYPRRLRARPGPSDTVWVSRTRSVIPYLAMAGRLLGLFVLQLAADLLGRDRGGGASDGPPISLGGLVRPPRQPRLVLLLQACPVGETGTAHTVSAAASSSSTACVTLDSMPEIFFRQALRTSRSYSHPMFIIMGAASSLDAGRRAESLQRRWSASALTRVRAGSSSSISAPVRVFSPCPAAYDHAPCAAIGKWPAPGAPRQEAPPIRDRWPLGLDRSQAATLGILIPPSVTMIFLRHRPETLDPRRGCSSRA